MTFCTFIRKTVGYSIRDLQKYFDTLHADVTKITVDYNLLYQIYKIKPIYVYIENDNGLAFDLSRFSKLTHFEYNLHGIHYTHCFYSRIFCMKVLESSCKGTNYVPHFKFHPDAPLTDISMPHIVWNDYAYNCQELIYRRTTVKHLTIKNVADKSWNSTQLFPRNLEILNLCDFKNNAAHCVALFNKYPGRIKMIGVGVYQITPESAVASAW